MTQNANDVEIANQGFAAFRQDLNDVLEDITTLHSGDTAPTTTYANQFWYETDTDKLYIRNEDNDAWIELLTLDQVNDKLASLNMQGGELILDADGDTSITADTDDRIDFRAGGSDTAHVTSTDFLVGKTTTAIGTAGSRLINNGQIQATASGNEPYFANRLSSDGTLFDFRKDGTTVGSIGVEGGDNFYITDNNNTGLNMKSGLIIPCNTNGSTRDNAIDLGASGARFNDLYLGGGVYLGGTGSANKLDDYEEGAWTPYYSATGGTGTVNYVSQRGYYTKIGNRVFFNLYLITSFWGTGGSGDLYISGLPYAASNSTHNFGSLSVGFTQGFIQSPTGGNTIPNSTEIILRKNSSSDARSDKDEKLTGTVGTDVSGGSNKNEIIATGFYFTTA